MVRLVKKEQGTSTAFVRRFMQRIQAGGILKEAKAKRFFVKAPNRNLRRRAALRRGEIRRHKAELRKLGKTK